MTEYTNRLTAEDLIYAIATDYMEFSYDKIRIQRDEHMKWCRDWLEHNSKKLPLDL